MKNDDQEWLDALSGKVTNKDKTLTQIEAISVRNALLARRKSIEQDSEKLDQNQFEKIKQLLKKHGHLVSDAGTKSPLQKKIALIASFIAGSISSGLIVFGLTSQVMTTRSGPELPAERKLQTSSATQGQPMINLQSSEPVLLAQALESKAWDIGLKTAAQGLNGVIILTIKDLSENNINESELKLLIGVHPKTKGDIVLKIAK